MDYRVLVCDDYNYFEMTENNETIYWHDYAKHNIILQLNDTIQAIVTGYEMEIWKVVGEKKFHSVEEAKADSEVYNNGWKNNFEKYFEDANGRFLKLERVEYPTGKRFLDLIPNHSIMEIKE